MGTGDERSQGIKSNATGLVLVAYTDNIVTYYVIYSVGSTKTSLSSKGAYRILHNLYNIVSSYLMEKKSAGCEQIQAIVLYHILEQRECISSKMLKKYGKQIFT